MNNRIEQLKGYLVPGRRVHLVGIGGVSMRPLGLVLQSKGVIVSGSDRDASKSTRELMDKGIPVTIGHKAESVHGADCIVRTAAIHDDNPEIREARSLGIPVFERAEALGVIMQGYKNAVCVSGTHGKTTTTSMMAHILVEAGRDPSVMVGGNLPLIGGGHRIGHGDTIVLESCEYCDSFLSFFPSLAVILNVELDHVDYFKDLAAIEHSFRKFAQLSSGGILANGDDPNVVETLQGLDYVSFGLAKTNRVRAENIGSDWRHLDVICDGQFYCHLDLMVLGRHNALNALASAGAAWMMGIPGEAVARGLATFGGAERRQQYKGTYNGALIYDDFAHHPKELEATIDIMRSLEHKRFIYVFQPYTYSRTEAMFDEFVEELKKADHAVVAEIYAAREVNTKNMTSRDMVAQIPGAQYCATLEDVTAYLRQIAQPGDLILTSGCGNIYLAGEALFQ